MSTNAGAPPITQAPGAGLPFLEWAIVRYVLIPRAARKLSWAGAAGLYRREGEKILALWEATDPDRLGERTLIPRLRGIEDSSRDWSVAMTVEHLCIVGEMIVATAGALRAGAVPPVPAVGTADVKPLGIATPSETHARFLALLAAAAELGAQPEPTADELRARFPHPWFGLINAHRWHCVNAIHQRLHRQQVESIRAQQS